MLGVVGVVAATAHNLGDNVRHKVTTPSYIDIQVYINILVLLFTFCVFPSSGRVTQRPGQTLPNALCRYKISQTNQC